MKLYTAQVIAALALVVPFLICSADQQNKNHDNGSKGIADHDAYQDMDVDQSSEAVNMASDDAGDYDSSEDSRVLLASQLEELVDKYMDEEKLSEGVDMENVDYDAQSQYEDDSVEQNENIQSENEYDGDGASDEVYEEDDSVSDEVYEEDNSVSDEVYEGDSYGQESTHAVKQNSGGKSGAVIFKYVKEYDFIWSDRGSGAKRDVSIWRPVDIEHGFFPLGDTASGRYGKPVIPAITVSAGVSGALAKPISYGHIWNDRGSGADRDVRIVKLIPPTGYTCLGDVAVPNYGRPDLNKYRCVKSQYVTSSDGLYDFVWNDRGSGADRDVTIYSNTNIDSIDARSANTFKATPNYSRLYGHPKLLRSSTSTEKSQAAVTPQEDKAIIVYQVTLKKQIWNDAGSGANRDFSSWRAQIPDGYYSLGDYGVATHRAPHFITLVKAVKEDALRAPLYFRQRWNDRGSGANKDVAFYEPICPSGYRALGHISIDSHRTQPQKRDIRCVKAEYAVKGKWQFIWNDRGSGADRDLSVYMAVPYGSGQGVRAMSTVPCYCGMDRTAYVLNRKYIQYIVSKPVKQYTMTNIKYNLDNRHVLSTSPEILANTFLENKGTTPQSTTRVITYSVSESHSWSETVGVEVGVEFSITTSVPLVASKSVKFSVKAKYETTTGETVTKTKQDQIRATVSILPKSSKTAVVTATRYVVDVPFTATLVAEYYDGTKSRPQTYKGTYKGVQVSDVHVVYNPDVPLSSTGR